MIYLKELSIVYTISFTLPLFLFLFEPRFSAKKTVTLSLWLMVPLLLMNFVLLQYVGPEKIGPLMLVTCSLPSLVFFWFLAKHRDGRFFFTFCLADTMVMLLLYSSTVLDYFLGNTTWFLIFARLIGCPLMVVLVYRYVRPFYLELQRKVETGWYLFAGISLLFYVLLTLTATSPTIVTSRPEYLPSMVLLLIAVPMIYFHILRSLYKQIVFHEVSERDHIMQVQVSSLRTRMEEITAAEDKFRIERHDFRHKLQTIAALAEKQEYDELRALLSEYNEDLNETQVKTYCAYPVLDAVLSSYLGAAERKHIQVRTALHFPDRLPVNEAELATVFANAIENAINACEKLKPSERMISIKVRTEPAFMIQISNSFDGHVQFDADGLPMRKSTSQGMGVHSIAAFCRKNNAHFEFKVDGKTFILRIQPN